MKVQMQNYNNHCANTLVFKRNRQKCIPRRWMELETSPPQNNSIIYYASRSICILFFNHFPRYVTSFNHYIKTGKCQILIVQNIYLISIRIQRITSICILHFDIFSGNFVLEGFLILAISAIDCISLSI